MKINKYMKKLAHQEKVNPGHKTPYEQPLRPRSTYFGSKKDYNRQAVKKATRAEIEA